MKPRKEQMPEKRTQQPTGAERFHANLGVVLALSFLSFLALGYGANSGRQMAQSTIDLGPLMPPVTILASFVALIGLNALFVAGETAVSRLKSMHVKYLKEIHGKSASTLQKMLENQSRLVEAAALGSQLTRALMVIGCFLFAPFAARSMHWPGTYANLAGAATLTLIPVAALNLIFGELIPKSFAALHPPRVAIFLRKFLYGAGIVFAAPLMVVSGVAGMLAARFGGKVNFGMPNAAEEEIKTIVETAESIGEIESEEKELLHSVFEFSDTIAREVMTPRVDLDAMPVRSDPMEIMRIVQETGHSRIPLYEETDDQIVGIIHAKDLLMAIVDGRAPNLRTLMRPALFVPENKNLHDLLKELKSHRTQLAIVQDEYGGTAGIVTIEDIVEELVGDIVDEYDVEEPEIQATENGWIVDGRAHVDDVNHALGSKFESDDYDTIGGFVFGVFGRQPKLDEFIETDGYRFTIANTDGRRVAQLRIEELSEPALNDDAAELI